VPYLSAGYQWPDLVADAFFEVLLAKALATTIVRHYVGWFKGEA